MSKLRVNDVLPANGLNIGIGTAGGNLIVGGASTTVVVNGDINITGNVTGGSNITVGANNGFHVDGGAPASSLTVNNLGNTVVGSGHSVYIADGNLVFQTAGTGIDFSAVGAGNTFISSNILADYEEGTWTPTSGTNFGAFTSANGSYVKIGNTVTLNFFFYAASMSTSAASYIGGLPYEVTNTISGTSVEATGVVFEDSRMYLAWPSGGSSTIAVETDRPIQGSTSSAAQTLRGSVTYLTS